MSLIVQKFGGSSVADRDRIFNVAGIATRTFSDGNDVIVVVSAQGDTTDELLAKASEINRNPTTREMDMLLSTGEQISISLLAMAIQSLGFPVVSLTGWQIGLRTDSNHSSARIKSLTNTRIQEELSNRKIVIVAGFQGINKSYDITTLGRGGSDTTAVALAAQLRADLCQIYTDVDGVYTADPRKIKNAKKLDHISYDEMLELATMGAQVLHNRSVELAKRYNVNLEVLSSFSGQPGTIVKENDQMEKMLVRGIAKDDDVAVIELIDVRDIPGIAFKVFSLIANKKISVDMILQSTGRNGNRDISFTIAKGNVDAAVKALDELKPVLGFSEVSVNEDVAKISLVGTGMINNAGIAAGMFEALSNSDINIQMISSSEIKISVLIDKKDADRAIQAIHDQFFD
ncbi:MAG: aspartate kinase [Proteocatella sp.]|nr:aspartate kinase [Proteocatella sp.]MBP8653921.1 aspartate kinase [Proteocatella sp.]MBP9658825.1 aspartate kinase [Proteocatella sp.]MBP9966614.1 aspartate kinase [Proteocatella sp.]NCB71184.1 aspartate kinase [Clostridia bacterium]